MEFGYWGIKGRAESIRWLIAYTGADVKEWNPTDLQAWVARKPETGPFPNLPFLIDGDVKITESGAIPYYIIHKTGKTELLGKTIQDSARIRQIEGVFTDIQDYLLKVLGSGPDFAAAIAKTLEPTAAVATKIAQLSSFLGEKDFFLGYLTWADIKAVAGARVVQSLALSLGQPCPFAKHANLESLIKRVEALPAIQPRVAASLAVPFFPPQLVPFPLKTQAEF